ncbi:glycosyltransferase involved in cell wall biosynthesis [Psychromicrobium silvestre]|uniref:Glycosyltransferase involved in cell wall biosynthesis n=1 Tax=Psychromicrobium silvestre TaxID=1645614 RepID=A0A7Y9LUT5_9MICC|nr:glycosyltransferase involved in cell wall biosynthesis [Psychromicrobium silvestre]
MFISVVIPVLNDSEFLTVCLAALAKQSRQADEIVVVDNGSSDDSAAVAKAAGAVVLLEPRRGILPATATGFNGAKGEVFARLDADSVPAQDWLERIERQLAEQPEAVAITGMGEFYGGNAFLRWCGRALVGGGNFRLLSWGLGYTPLYASNMAIRASAWYRIRAKVHLDHAVNDDTDICLQFEPDMVAIYDSELRVGVSARPFYSWAALGHRLGLAFRTLGINFREQSLCSRRRVRRKWARAQRLRRP